MIPTDVSGSRFPVGSSQIRSGGWLTTARAIETRCCSPPESSSGSELDLVREADEREHLRHLAADVRAALALHLQRVGDVLGRRAVREQLEVLEDAADVAAQQRHLRALEPGQVAAADEDRGRRSARAPSAAGGSSSTCRSRTRRRRRRTRPCRSRRRRRSARRRSARRSSSRARTRSSSPSRRGRVGRPARRAVALGQAAAPFSPAGRCRSAALSRAGVTWVSKSGSCTGFTEEARRSAARRRKLRSLEPSV